MLEKRDGIILHFAHQIVLQAINWLWRFWIAVGKVHLLVGDPSSGKTTLLAELLAAFSMGGLLPDGTRAPKVFCIYWSGEDGIEDTVGVRLKAAGANLRNILILRGVAEHGRKRFFKPTDLPSLVNEIKRLRADGIDVRVIAIDPLPAGSGNSNSNDDVRRTLEPLIVLAEEEGIAIIGVRHLSKASTKKKLAERINGSVAYLAISRIAMFVVKITGTGTAPDNPPRGVLVRAKSNIGPTDGGFAFTVEPYSIEVDGGTADSVRLTWDVQALTGDPEAIVRAAESNAGASIANDLADETHFLRDLLDRGPVHSNKVLTLGKEEGFIPEKLRQALAALGGNSGKEPGRPRGPWYWWLPGAGFDESESPLDHDDSYRSRRDVRTTFRRGASPKLPLSSLHSRDEGRFDDSYAGGISKDEKDEEYGKVEKSINTRYDDIQGGTSLNELPGNSDEDAEDGSIGV
ncbi:AAA domain protein [Bordetella hinzii 1277]|uniref:AAA family ATPase n=1 Tax=Bordetella hinzii TaxID=103855 RepID=UPI00045B630E|nr:AAA family ATPase [Bordetella hinzii]KCB52828.1 AAA domain protein [Bordetella hinzii 1277]